MIVRRAIVSDASALTDVAKRAITITAASAYDADQIAQWSGSFSPEALERVAETTAAFVVEDAGHVAGFANLGIDHTGRAELDLLYVDPEFSGRGVARLAVDAVESEARRRGVSEVWADASLLAAPVLEHLGYTVSERYEKARGAVTYSNTWLVKQLT